MPEENHPKVGRLEEVVASGFEDASCASRVCCYPLSTWSDPLHWKAQRDSKAKMLSLQSFLRKGVPLSYVEHSKPKGPNGPDPEPVDQVSALMMMIGPMLMHLAPRTVGVLIVPQVR